MKSIAIIQARMGSSRLPGKSLMDLRGQPILAWVVRAAKAVIGIDAVIVATSTLSDDNQISDWCDDNNIDCFRGSNDDVLSRFYYAAKAKNASYILRLTADCPFLDPAVCNAVLYLLLKEKADYVSNTSPPSWPDGLDCEGISFTALENAHFEACLTGDREHVSQFIFRNRSRFKTHAIICPIPGLGNERWVVDCLEDLNFVRTLAKQIERNKIPSYIEILTILKHLPNTHQTNISVSRNEGLAKSQSIEKFFEVNKFDRSIAMLERAEKVIPLGSQTFSKSHTQFPKNVAPLFVSHGEGGRIWDIDGNEYVDLICGLLPVSLGYRDPDVDHAVREQLTCGISFSLATELEAELAEQIINIIPSAEMVRFGKNGTDATSASIRLARAFTGRDKVIVCGYHGWQDWYIGSTTRDKGVPPLYKKLTFSVPFNDLGAVRKLLREHSGEFAAMILEPMSSIEPVAEYLNELKALLHKHGVLLIFDEVVTGFRYSLGGAQSLFGVTPDLSSFGKGLGNGMPISAIVGRADIMKQMEEVFVSGTFGGESLSLAAAIAVIKKMHREPVIETLWNTGDVLAVKVNKLITQYNLDQVITLNGCSPWIILNFAVYQNVETSAVRTLFVAEMLKRGVLILNSHNICYAHNSTDIEKVVSAYDGALRVIREAFDSGSFKEWLNYPAIDPVFQVRKL